MSKRIEVRQRRKQDQTRNNIITIAIIAVGVLLVLGVLVWPYLKPVGDIKTATAQQRQNIKDSSYGDPNAPVKVEEFSDFQCPYCQMFAEKLEPVLNSTYIATGKVYFTYVPFSFIGEESVNASKAAYCAMDQGKFWEYHDILFANQTGENIGDFTSRRLSAFAETLKLNTSTFQSCMDSNKYQTKVLQDKANGEKRGVQGTPYFFVNGTGPIDANQLNQAIEDALKK